MIAVGLELRVESRTERPVAGTAAGAAQVSAGLRHRRSVSGSWAAGQESAAEDIDLAAIGYAEPEVIARVGSLGSGLAEEETGSCAAEPMRIAEARLAVIVHIVLEAAAGFGRPVARGLDEAIDSSVADQEHIVEAEVKSIVEGEGIESTAALVVGEPG